MRLPAQRLAGVLNDRLNGNIAHRVIRHERQRPLFRVVGREKPFCESSLVDVGDVDREKDSVFSELKHGRIALLRRRRGFVFVGRPCQKTVCSEVFHREQSVFSGRSLAVQVTIDRRIAKKTSAQFVIAGLPYDDSRIAGRFFCKKSSSLGGGHSAGRRDIVCIQFFQSLDSGRTRFYANKVGANIRDAKCRLAGNHPVGCFTQLLQAVCNGFCDAIECLFGSFRAAIRVVLQVVPRNLVIRQIRHLFQRSKRFEKLHGFCCFPHAVMINGMDLVFEFFL